MNYTQKRKPTQSYWSGFTTYCRRLCIQSLITGFPVIAATRNVLRKALKIFVFVVCTCGFLYQTSGFLNLYWAYPTMVGIQMENPDSVSLPAVTVCNRNRIRRKALCTLAPSICQWSTNRDIFCSVNPKYCVPWETDEQTVLAIPNFDILFMMNRTLENVEKMGQRPEDLIAGCSIRSDIFSTCTNILTVSVVNNNGYPNNCVAIETLWGQPDGQPQKLPVTGQISLYLTMRPEDYIDYYDLVLAHVFMHEPQSLCNPIKEGITLEAGKSYDIFVNKRVTIRLPAPYKTNCTDYSKLWRKNGGHGPLTGKACTEKCRMESMVKKMGCVHQSVSYPTNYTICEDPDVFPSEDILEKCSRECSEACWEESYSLRSEVKFDQAEKCSNDLNCEKKDMFLNFIFNRLEVEKFVHEPRYESVEMFSYIGGYMGMWLGISLVALFDFLEILFCLLFYPLRSKNKLKKIAIPRVRFA